ncbi:hypothetical protein AURDEDRAFT_144656 [Auricularia subglabra TFB-10046 SS5]|nr:hypothetical protein AURDEDRAFT_144656 [Auricularia subglabra TFB-10046 SS5]
MAPSIALLLALLCSTASAFSWDDVQAVYAFGDSYSFVGGTRGHANFSFIGDSDNFAFTPHELLTDEIIPKNTSSDGSNWLEFLTGCFAGPPHRCERQLWAFAFAGADIADALLPRHLPFIVPLTLQVTQYLRYARGVIPRSDPARTLVAWWIGINDAGDTIDRAGEIGDFEAFWEREMDRYFAAVKRIDAAGLARAHLFLNVPPGERSPNTLNTGNATRVALHAARVSGFNAALARRLAQFRATAHAHVLAFDVHGWFNAALDNAAALGFTNVTGYCQCRDKEGFFWYDFVHPTEAVHRLLARDIDAALRSH